MSRRAIAVVILGAWLVVVGWMVKRQYFRPRSEILAAAALNVAPGATFYRIALGGQQIGYASSLVDTLPDTLRILDQMQLHIPAMGTVQRIDTRTEAILTRSLRLRSFRATLRGDDVRFGVAGTVDGDTLLSVTIESADSRQSLSIRLAEPVLLPTAMPLQLTFGSEMEIGRSYTLRLFDPLQLAHRDVDVTVLAESTFVVPDSARYVDDQTMWIPARWDTLHAWKVSQTLGGMRTEAWIDDVGQIVQASSPMGFSLERTAFEIAFENFRRRDAALVGSSTTRDLIRQTAIASSVTLDQETLAELRVRLAGVDLTTFDLSGGRQVLLADTLTVRREGASQLDARYRIPSADSALAPFLVPEPLVQSDDQRILAQARQIAGRTRSPERVARLLNDWVYEHLEKRITVSVPSAVEVLETRRGDCNEHTVLYVALARALGLPARTAAGLVYLDGRFFYHAWPEVYLNEWVAVDPTFGQFPADAAHLRFTIGGLARQVELIQLIGRLELDVVEATEVP